MAIPGMKPTQIDVRAKVRIGEKTEKFARSLDYFVTDDPEWLARHAGEGTSEFPIVFVHADPEDAFRTGLEWWKGAMLACYSDDGGDDPTAYRVSGVKSGTSVLNWLDKDDQIRGEPVGQGRTPIACRFRDCRHFGSNAKNKECRVKGRLTFLLPGGQTDKALQFETKGWNTIEALSGTLASCRRSGPLNAPGREFVLFVVMEQDGSSRYPVVNVREVGEKVEVNTDAEITLADALVQLRGVVERESEDAEIKLRIAAVLDHTSPGWRESQEFIAAMQARVAELGIVGSAKALLDKFETKAAA